ncbi:MAG: tRNA (adenosine(37)-N6)-dimethylallyltransferase MiaA [Actinobacteria bacterium]|nr:tRNA (adenosine(37)-N6)-dimethylallyltransferase MiaA [Actinomycetota bacterium]
MTGTAAPAVTAIVGPTAAGKSAIAETVASTMRAEIVAVDAFTIYRGMDIGTDTPVAPAVAHHMVDVLDPSVECTAQWFQRRARAAIADVLRRGRHPLLVGGSGLYFRAVVDPLEFPPTDAQVRADLERRYPHAAAAHDALAVADPDTAATVDPGNWRRAIRALEVVTLTGRSFLSWRVAWDDYTPWYSGLRVVGVDIARDQLAQRIVDRVDAMLAAGWVDEAARLRGRALSRTAAAAIGYAELWEHLDSRCTLAQARERIIVRTRRYAVRQQRWFAADRRVRWMAPAAATHWLLEGPGRVADTDRHAEARHGRDDRSPPAGSAGE